MKGYLHNPRATAESLTDDGWCRTGDIAQIDENGFVSIVDRLKELIKYKAYHVAPAELEAVLLSHPLLTDAAVVASPDDEAGEVPKAFLVVKDAVDPELAAEQAIAYVAEQVAAVQACAPVRDHRGGAAYPVRKIVRRDLIARERLARTAAH